MSPTAPAARIAELASVPDTCHVDGVVAPSSQALAASVVGDDPLVANSILRTFPGVYVSPEMIVEAATVACPAESTRNRPSETFPSERRLAVAA